MIHQGNLNVRGSTDENPVYVSTMPVNIAVDDIKFDHINIINQNVCNADNTVYEYIVDASTLHFGHSNNETKAEKADVNQECLKDEITNKDLVFIPRIPENVLVEDLNANNTTNKYMLYTTGLSINISIKAENNNVITLAKDASNDIEYATDLSKVIIINGVKPENYSTNNQVYINPEHIGDRDVCVSYLQEKNSVDAVKVLNNYLIKQDNIDNITLINTGAQEDAFVGTGHSFDDSIPSAEASQKVRSHTRTKSTKVNVDTCWNPDADDLLVNNKWSCYMCPYQTTNERQLRTHFKAHDAPVSYSCNKCSYKTIHKCSLTRHFNLHCSQKPYSCDVSHKAFNNNCNLTRHSRKRSSDTAFSCEICHKTYSKKYHLSVHLRTHSGDIPFSCGVCHKEFIRKDYLINHMRIHSGEKPFVCEICDKTFSQKAHMTVHLSTHSGEKNYSCDVCNKAFNRKNNLRTHTRTHSGEIPFSCPVCRKQFHRKEYLIKHLRIHSGEKPYSCYVCNKTFNQKAHLAGHLTTHTGEKPFSCNVCNKAFNRKTNLKTHSKTHSKERPSSGEH